MDNSDHFFGNITEDQINEIIDQVVLEVEIIEAIRELKYRNPARMQGIAKIISQILEHSD